MYSNGYNMFYLSFALKTFETSFILPKCRVVDMLSDALADDETSLGYASAKSKLSSRQR